MEKLSEFIIKYRLPVIISTLLVSLFFASRIPRAEVESDVKQMLPRDMPSRITLDKIEEIFGGTDMALMIFQNDDVLNEKTLRRIKKISRKVKRVKGVDDVLSLFELKEIRGENNTMYVNPAIYDIPKTGEEREELRQRIRDNDIVYGSVVSKDFKYTAVIALTKSNANDSEVLNGMKKIVRDVPGDDRVIFGGMLTNRVSISSDIRTDMKRFLPFGLLIMVLFLYACFRQARGVLLPFLVVIMSIMFAMGLIPVLGWKIQMITVMLPVVLIAVANDYGIHLVSKYQEDNIEGNDLTEVRLAKNVFTSLGKPVIATGLTTMAGLLCLLSHIIIPAEQFGILAAAGILFALIASLFFIPAMLSLLPKAKPVILNDKRNSHFIERTLHKISEFVAGAPKKIIILSVILTAIVSIGIKYIIVDTNPENYYPEDSPVVQAAKIVNSDFGGSTSISVVARGDMKDPWVLRRIDSLEREIKAMPEIGFTMSISRAVKQMSRALNRKDSPNYEKIPETRNAVAQYFELYNMSGEPDDFERLMDFNYEHAQISARINNTSSEVIKSVAAQINNKIKNDSLFETTGGFANIFSELVDEVISGQVTSLSLSLIIVGIMIMLLFRSFTAGIFSIIPLLLSMLFLFGLMGYAGIELNIGTAMLSSIMVGVGIDYTIHYLWRYREERARGHAPGEAVKITLQTIGRGIIFNALSVIIGFVVLLISNFLPVKFFGFLVVVTISICLISALMLLPSMCIIFEPAFLNPEKNGRKR